jgi:hypothetical protein
MKQSIFKNSNGTSTFSAIAIIFACATILSFEACTKDNIPEPSPLRNQQQNEKPLGITKVVDIGEDEYIAIEKTGTNSGFVVLSKGLIYRPTTDASNRIIKQTTLNGTTYTIEILNSGCQVWIESDSKTGKILKYQKSCP